MTEPWYGPFGPPPTGGTCYCYQKNDAMHCHFPTCGGRAKREPFDVLEKIGHIEAKGRAEIANLAEAARTAIDEILDDRIRLRNQALKRNLERHPNATNTTWVVYACPECGKSVTWIFPSTAMPYRLCHHEGAVYEMVEISHG